MTKKMLVPYSISRDKPVGRSFVVPTFDGERRKFLSLSNGATVEYAMVAFVGKSVQAKDLFKKMVDSGAVILPSTDEAINSLSEYVAHVATFKVGDVIKLGFDENDQPVFEKQAKLERGQSGKKLP